VSACQAIDAPIAKEHLDRGHRCLIAAASLGVASLLKSQALKISLRLCRRHKLREKLAGKSHNEACASQGPIGAPIPPNPASNKTERKEGHKIDERFA
jgi:hypothetical protein